MQNKNLYPLQSSFILPKWRLVAFVQMAIRPMWFWTVFLMCGEHLSRIMHCGMASHSYNFINFCTVKYGKGRGVVVILSSFPTGCQVEDFLGRKGNYFLWFQKNQNRFWGNISNSTLFGFRPDQSLCSFVNFIKHVVQRSG